MKTPSIANFHLGYFQLTVQLDKCLSWQSAGGGKTLLEAWGQSRAPYLIPVLTAASASEGVDLHPWSLVKGVALPAFPFAVSPVSALTTLSCPKPGTEDVGLVYFCVVLWLDPARRHPTFTLRRRWQAALKVPAVSGRTPAFVDIRKLPVF